MRHIKRIISAVLFAAMLITSFQLSLFQLTKV